MPELTPKTIWTDMRGNFSPYPTLTCNKPWDADKPWPPVGPVPSNPPSSGVRDAPGWTPGPWTYAPIPGYQYVVEIEKASQIFLCAGAVPPGREAEIRANAQLAAHAPDLYAALDDLTDITVCIDGPIETEPQFFSDLRNRTRRALSALAKARGEKPDAE